MHRPRTDWQVTKESAPLRGNILELNGVAHIALTPFNEDETIDFTGIENIVDEAVNVGCTAVVPLGIMGESHKLLDSERDEVLRAYVERAGDRLHVIAGITSESTAVAVARAESALRLGATAAMMAPPRNFKPGPGLVEHYRAVARTGIPVVVQDEPVTTGVIMPGEFIGQLAEIPGVFCAKVEEAPSPPKVSAILEHAPNLLCLGGLGGVAIYEELARGAVGIMTGFGFPGILVQICERYLAGDHAEARRIFHHYLPIIRFEAQLGVGGVAIRKQLFYERGLIATPLARRPARPVDARTVEELGELLDILELRNTND
ncbi:dihydrodipicolinate synthase family protein [Salinibacterium sp. dk2585]|uniref:dihydrodipicolinate synthase family protein n=1 Tax=unclassified Salinibacterium TaxID=2632331 RepID=UPI0011C255FD|nr:MULTISPECIES: dihydrodipicolinate synthase family protein [unclassified Salinibacterium]QEE61022.1 dihydrodipicolinate synthase family protein [Salinibacterium sp. dk2585]TXK52964.1 dihydrodipicolinate synthase family protein [Salinibacterium sp. dk5596]